MQRLHLLNLPLEIRDRIYDFVFEGKKVRPITLDKGIKKHILLGNQVTLWTWARAPRTPNDVLALLFVNHQISDEVMSNFYGSHIIMGTRKHLGIFVDGIGNRRDRIRSVELTEVPESPDAAEGEWQWQWRGHGDRLLDNLMRMPLLQTVRIHTACREIMEAEGNVKELGFHRLDKSIDIVHINVSSQDGVDIHTHKCFHINAINIWKKAKDSSEWTKQEERVERSERPW